MADDVLLNKAAVIECCVARALEEYAAAGGGASACPAHPAPRRKGSAVL
jgi:hypothetical protein